MMSSLLFLPFFLSIRPQLLAVAASPIDDYPNPLRDGQFAKCKMPRKSYLCDPDEVLSSEERETLAQMLDSFRDQTKNDGGQSGCKKKGVTGAVALTKKPLYFKINSRWYLMKRLNCDTFRGKQFNNTADAPFRLLHKWDLDIECRKAFLVVLPTDVTNFGRIAFFFATPILQDEINHLYAAEQQMFQQKRWFDAIRGLLVGIRKIVNDRHGILSGDGQAEDVGGEDEIAWQQQAVVSPNSATAPPSTALTHFMLSICTIFASVALTLGILWKFQGHFYATRNGRPLLMRFNNPSMDA